MIVFVVGIDGSPHKECAKCLYEAYRYINLGCTVVSYMDIDMMYDPSNAKETVTGNLYHAEAMRYKSTDMLRSFNRIADSIIPVSFASIQFNNWLKMTKEPFYDKLRQASISCTIFNLLREDKNDYRMSDEYHEFKECAIGKKSQVDFIIDRTGLSIDDDMYRAASGATLDILLRIQTADWVAQQFLPDDDPMVKKLHRQYKKLYELAADRIIEHNAGLSEDINKTLVAYDPKIVAEEVCSHGSSTKE